MRSLESAGAVTVLSVGLILSGCGSDAENQQHTGSSVTAENCEPSALSELRSGDLEAAFEVMHDWSNMPERASGDDVPCQKTEEDCKDFWQDREGRRGPVVQEGPIVAIIDGSCNEPLSSDEVGAYAVPRQDSSQLVAVLHNGDALGLECIMRDDPNTPAEETEPIQDVRGPSSRSSVWLGGVVLIQGVEVRVLVPATNAGYPDVAGYPDC